MASGWDIERGLGRRVDFRMILRAKRHAGRKESLDPAGILVPRRIEFATPFSLSPAAEIAFVERLGLSRLEPEKQADHEQGGDPEERHHGILPRKTSLLDCSMPHPGQARGYMAARVSA
jgi:hypothetical protein